MLSSCHPTSSQEFHSVDDLNRILRKLGMMPTDVVLLAQSIAQPVRSQCPSDPQANRGLARGGSLGPAGLSRSVAMTSGAPR
jgi:hypothetical protein